VRTEWDFDDFTEASYRAILELSASRYAFEPFGTDAVSPHVLWRHDVDYSVHRGVALARIEAEMGVRSTYFLSLHSDLYSVLEPKVNALARELAALSHWLGLHFDVGFYADRSPAAVDEHAAWEAGVLADALDVPIHAVSLHNPSVSGSEELDAERIGGLVHAGARSVRDRYTYVSDSNGYWRFERLPDVLEAGRHERLHVLTHPEWWQERPMSPRERIVRCIEGRGRAAEATYDALLANNARVNVGLPDAGGISD
jgi:hypothetical protein